MTAEPISREDEGALRWVWLVVALLLVAWGAL